MCRSSRCGLPPRGSFGLCLHHSYIYSPAPLGRPGVPHALQGPEPLPGGAPYYGGGPPGSNSPYPVGHPHQPPGGAPGGLVLRPRAGGQRAWARGPVAQGQLASNPPRRHGRPSPPRQCRHGQGGVRGSCPWATTRHRAHHAAWPTCARFWIYHASARVRAAPFPLRAFTPPRAVLPPSPHPGSARSPSVHGHPNPGAAPGPRPVASRQLADRAGRAPSRAPSCPGPRPPSLARSHRPSSPANWPVASHHPGRGAPVRLPQAPSSPGPGPGSRRRRPTPYTLHPTDGATTSRAQPPNSNSTHNSRVESSSGVQLGSCDTLGRSPESLHRGPGPPAPHRLPGSPRPRPLPADTRGSGPRPRGPAHPAPPREPPPPANWPIRAPVADAVRPPRRPCQAANWSAAPGKAAGPAAADRRRCLPPISVCQLASASGHAAQRGGRPPRSPASPLQAPGAAGGDDGEVCLHKSSQGSG